MFLCNTLDFLSRISRRTALVAALCAPLCVAQVIPPRGTAALGKVVFVGDSLSAGFQSYSLYDSDSDPMHLAGPGGQKHGFAALIAQQIGENLNLPLFQYPGFPPVITLQNGVLTRGTMVGSREPQTVSVQTLDLSVPGYTISDALAHAVNLPLVEANPQSANPIDLLTLGILGAPGLINPAQACGIFPGANGYVTFSEAYCAAQLQPTTIVVSIGNNDALQAVLDGIPPTDPQEFERSFDTLITILKSTGANVIVGNVPDVSAIPILYSYLDFQNLCGTEPGGALPGDYVVPNINNPAATSFNLCTNYSVRSAALIAQARLAVLDYNTIIRRDAHRYAIGVAEVNATFHLIATEGYNASGLQLTSKFFGGIFSLDGVHPTNTGYAILANTYIAAMNEQLQANIPLVDVAQVALTDPLLPAVQH